MSVASSSRTAVVYDIPFHYANPVSGRTQMPKIPSMDEQMAQMPMKAE
jgi:hypothetical protein